MDPNATLQFIEDWYDDKRPLESQDEDVLEHASALHTWLARGGFAPDWDEYPVATKFYRELFHVNGGEQ